MLREGRIFVIVFLVFCEQEDDVDVFRVAKEGFGMTLSGVIQAFAGQVEDFLAIAENHAARWAGLHAIGGSPAFTRSTHISHLTSNLVCGL